MDSLANDRCPHGTRSASVRTEPEPDDADTDPFSPLVNLDGTEQTQQVTETPCEVIERRRKEGEPPDSLHLNYSAQQFTKEA